MFPSCHNSQHNTFACRIRLLWTTLQYHHERSTQNILKHLQHYSITTHCASATKEQQVTTSSSRISTGTDAPKSRDWCRVLVDWWSRGVTTDDMRARWRTVSVVWRRRPLRSLRPIESRGLIKSLFTRSSEVAILMFSVCVTEANEHFYHTLFTRVAITIYNGNVMFILCSSYEKINAFSQYPREHQIFTTLAPSTDPMVLLCFKQNCSPGYNINNAPRFHYHSEPIDYSLLLFQNVINIFLFNIKMITKVAFPGRNHHQFLECIRDYKTNYPTVQDRKQETELYPELLVGERSIRKHRNSDTGW